MSPQRLEKEEKIRAITFWFAEAYQPMVCGAALTPLQPQHLWSHKDGPLMEPSLAKESGKRESSGPFGFWVKGEIA